MLLEASHGVQEALLERCKAAEPHRFLIYGGKGEMGVLLAQTFEARGHEVEVIDQDFDGDEIRLLAWASIVLIAVPMQVAVDTIRRLVPIIREDQLLCDINSLKADVCAAYEGCRGETLGHSPDVWPYCDLVPAPKKSYSARSIRVP